MFWRGLCTAALVLAGLGAAGCFSSEAEYQALLEDNNTLSVELTEARRENEILGRALDDIKREQESLLLLLNAGKSNLTSGRASLPTALQLGGGPPQAAAPANEEPQAPRPPAPATPPPSPAPPRAAAQEGGRIYVTRPGDVLTNIAQANRTTVARILELNPHLRSRRNYMIYDNERIRLP